MPALALTPSCVLPCAPQAFQRQIHERLTQLELINKQYRRLARENRTDTASKLKHMVHEGNQRWDNLQKRVTAVLRRLRVTFSPSPALPVGRQGEAIGDTRLVAKQWVDFSSGLRYLNILPAGLPFGLSQSCQCSWFVLLCFVFFKRSFAQE